MKHFFARIRRIIRVGLTWGIGFGVLGIVFIASAGGDFDDFLRIGLGFAGLGFGAGAVFTMAFGLLEYHPRLVGRSWGKGLIGAIVGGLVGFGFFGFPQYSFGPLTAILVGVGAAHGVGTVSQSDLVSGRQPKEIAEADTPTAALEPPRARPELKSGRAE